MKTKLFLLTVILVTATCCKTKANEEQTSFNAETSNINYECAPPPPPPPPPPSNSTSDFSSSLIKNNQIKLIKTGELTITSKDIEESKRSLKAILKECNGNIAYEYLTNSKTESYYNFTFFVPAENFEKFTDKLENLKLEITEKTFRIRDITSEYIDETTRLKNKKKLEQTYLDLLSKTKSISDIIEIQEKIESIREDIESKEEVIKTLDNRVAFSEINIKVITPEVAKRVEREYKSYNSAKFSDAFYIGITGILKTLVFLLSIWPIYVIAGILYITFRIIRNRRKKQQD